jgi:ligand-binding sensor domain-containing protein
MFADFPIISMAASIRGDSLYVGTAGAGVTRVYRNDVDGISGASSYGKWASIIMPSNYVCSIYIAPDGTQWFGTDKGIARHAGSKTLENWSVYTTDEGLIDNFVQAITADKDRNLWFGTKNGISVFDGSDWTAYTKDNGLSSNNILCLGSDSDGIIWIGTSDGVNCFKNGEFISFK